MPTSQQIAQSVSYWRQSGLSPRASYVLAKADISIAQLAKYKDVDSLIGNLKNCGFDTAEEIWASMKNLEGVKADQGPLSNIKPGINRSPKVKEVRFEDLIPK